VKYSWAKNRLEVKNMGDKLVRTVVIVIVALIVWYVLGMLVTGFGVAIPSVIMSLIALLIVILIAWYIIHNIWGFNF
jgi:Na+-driven multidrug efflux pump